MTTTYEKCPPVRLEDGLRACYVCGTHDPDEECVDCGVDLCGNCTEMVGEVVFCFDQTDCDARELANSASPRCRDCGEQHPPEEE